MVYRLYHDTLFGRETFRLKFSHMTWRGTVWCALYLSIQFSLSLSIPLSLYLSLSLTHTHTLSLTHIAFHPILNSFSAQKSSALPGCLGRGVKYLIQIQERDSLSVPSCPLSSLSGFCHRESLFKMVTFHENFLHKCFTIASAIKSCDTLDQVVQ